MPEEEEEKEEIIIPQARFMAVCEFCFDHNPAPVMEWNFKDKAVYYLCKNCRKRNTMTIKSNVPMPYPKVRLQG